jgi:RND family efflux transporter MFP subunit
MSAPHKEHPSASALLGAKDKQGALAPLIAGAVLLLGAAVLSIGFLSGGGASSAPEGSPVASQGPGGPALVRAVTVGSGELLRERRLPGELVAERRAALNAEVGGQLTRVERRLGEAVKKGELLVVIAAGVLPAELRRAEAQADAQQARADRARIVSEQQARNLQRREALHKEGAVSLGELDVARTDVRTAEVDLALADAEARQIQAEVAALRVRLAQTRVDAPFDGRVAALHVDPGSVVAPGAPLLELVADALPLVRFAVAEGDSGAIQIGQRLRLKTATSERQAEVVRIGAAVDATSRTLAVEAVLFEGAGPALPGMFVEVVLAASAPAGAAVVPLAVLKGRGAQRTAFVIAEGEVKARQVRVLLDDGERAAVEGLTPGEVVAGGAVDELSDGRKVQVMP